jgi:hypothetical protein
VTRPKVPLTRNRVQLQNRLEALREQAPLKLSSLVSDLLGVSARRMLEGLADGATDPGALAALADHRWRATPEQLRDALEAGQELSPVYRRLLKMVLEELPLLDSQISRLDQEMAELLMPVSGPGPAASGGARARGGFGAADPGRGRSHCRDLSVRGPARVLGWAPAPARTRARR